MRDANSLEVDDFETARMVICDRAYAPIDLARARILVAKDADLRDGLQQPQRFARRPGDPLMLAADLAASGQQVYALVADQILAASAELGSSNLVLTGGCALNSASMARYWAVARSQLSTSPRPMTAMRSGRLYCPGCRIIRTHRSLAPGLIWRVLLHWARRSLAPFATVADSKCASWATQHRNKSPSCWHPARLWASCAAAPSSGHGRWDFAASWQIRGLRT